MNNYKRTIKAWGGTGPGSVVASKAEIDLSRYLREVYKRRTLPGVLKVVHVWSNRINHWNHEYDGDPQSFPWRKFVSDFPMLRKVVAQYLDREATTDAMVVDFLDTLHKDLFKLNNRLGSLASDFRATINDFGF